MASPVVIVSTVHVPVAVVISAFLLVAGVVFMILCTLRYRRTLQRPWIVLSGAAGILVLISAIGLVSFFVRSLGR